jgi:hypothetical protein
VFNASCAIFASAVSTPEAINPPDTRKKGSLEISDDLFPTNLLRHIASPPQEATFGICLPAVPAAPLLTGLMIISTPVATAPVWRRPRSVSHSYGDVIGA